MLRSARMAASTGRTAASGGGRERQQWAVLPISTLECLEELKSISYSIQLHQKAQHLAFSYLLTPNLRASRATCCAATIRYRQAFFYQGPANIDAVNDQGTTLSSEVALVRPFGSLST